MTRRSAANERRLGDLITRAHRLSNPINRTPQQPSQSAPPYGSIQEGIEGVNVGQCDRSEPPPWFDSRADEPPIEAPDEEVPLLPDDIDVPEPTPQEEQSAGRLGTEALAYYAPFHFYGPAHWGIYIRDWGLVHLVCAFKETRHLTSSDAWLLRGAYRFLLEHERFHFRTEIAATRLQFLAATQDLYKSHFYDPHAGWLEEAMANASAHGELTAEATMLGTPSLSPFVAFLEKWMLTQPAGYRDYGIWSRSRYHYAKGMRGLTARMLELGSPGHPMLQHADPYTLDLYKRSDYSLLPVRRVRDSGLAALAFFKPFPRTHGLQAFVYTRDHPPPHVHVEFVARGRVVKLQWPDLKPLDPDSQLSGSDRRAVCNYLTANHDDIFLKLQKTYPGTSLSPLQALP
jgi:hypothetical protein